MARKSEMRQFYRFEALSKNRNFIFAAVSCIIFKAVSNSLTLSKDCERLIK